jgi:hypothetical protein
MSISQSSLVSILQFFESVTEKALVWKLAFLFVIFARVHFKCPWKQERCVAVRSQTVGSSGTWVFQKIWTKGGQSVSPVFIRAKHFPGALALSKQRRTKGSLLSCHLFFPKFSLLRMMIKHTLFAVRTGSQVVHKLAHGTFILARQFPQVMRIPVKFLSTTITLSKFEIFTTGRQKTRHVVLLTFTRIL